MFVLELLGRRGYMNIKILGLIPARGGSKGVPKKNIKILGDKPLIAYTIEAARACSSINELIVSTDNDEIAATANKYGVAAPFIRPPSIADDIAPMIDVIKHALTFYQAQGKIFEAICLLQPTTPFRTTEDIKACVKLMEKYDADTVITTISVPDVYNPYWVYFEKDRKLTLSMPREKTSPRRQDLPKAFGRAGSVYLIKTKTIMDNNSMYGKVIIGHEIPHERNINIDTMDDWLKAEEYLRGNDGYQ